MSRIDTTAAAPPFSFLPPAGEDAAAGIDLPIVIALDLALAPPRPAARAGAAVSALLGRFLRPRRGRRRPHRKRSRPRARRRRR